MASTSDITTWLESVPLLTERMRAEVVTAYRQGLLESPLPVILTDLDGRILAANRHAEELTGLQETELYLRPVTEFAHEEDRRRVEEAVQQLSTGQLRQVVYEARWIRPDGRVAWLRRHVIRVQDELDGRACLVCIIENLTDERLAQCQASAFVAIGRLITSGAALDVVAEQLAGLAEEVWEGVGCSLTVLNDSGDELLPVAHGRLPDSFVDSLGRIPADEHGAACGAAVATAGRVAIADLRTDPRGRRFGEALRAHGVVSGWSVPVFDPTRRIVGALGLFHGQQREPDEQDWEILERLADIAGIAVFVDAERQRHERERHDERRDRLTGLPNALAFSEHIRPACDTLSTELTVAVARFEDPADVATVLGENAVTAAVAELAGRAESADGVFCTALVGPLKIAVAALGQWSAEQADALSERLSRPLTLMRALAVRPEIRVGVASKAAGTRTTPESLLRQAELAVPDAGAALFDARVAHEQVQRYELAAQVSGALLRSELVVHYQPKYDLATGRLLGSEALVRWEHPERGLLSPAQVLPAVELAGASRELALLVLETTVRDREARLARGLTGRVAVNLTSDDVRSDAVLTALTDAADEWTDVLELELTESSVADSRAVVALERLAALGYAISLDDFGTGYSSLSALHTLPLACVKIDRSFVGRLPEDLAASALIRAVTSMCSRLGMCVIAEGVETLTQAVATRELGCTGVQGYYFERPRAVHDLDVTPTIELPARLPQEPPPPPDGAALELARSLQSQGASVHTIAAALNRAGLQSPRGTRWHARSVQWLLGTA